MARRDPLAGYEPGQALDFVQRGAYGAGGTVHVVSRASHTVEELAPALDPAAPNAARNADMVAWALLRVRTVCGINIDTAPGCTPGGVGISVFPDELLCGRCHKLLGDQSDRAFEHPQPGQEEES